MGERAGCDGDRGRGGQATRYGVARQASRGECRGGGQEWEGKEPGPRDERVEGPCPGSVGGWVVVGAETRSLIQGP